MSRNSVTRRVEHALAAFAAGRFVVVADSPDREDEGDLILAAERATPEALAFLVRHTSGIICVSLPGERLRELGLPPMVSDNADPYGTAFTVSVDWKHGTTTGISAADRATTIRGLADPVATAEDFLSPGHVFPLRCREGGVLARPGHTEAAADLARLAGLQPAGVLCEIVNDDGTMIRGAALAVFAERHGFPFITIPDLIAFRRAHERIIERVTRGRLSTAHGTFQACVYRSKLDGSEHVAIVKGEVEGRENVPVRLHRECFTGDVLHSTHCNCGRQLQRALARIEREGAGVVVYLRRRRGGPAGLGLAPHAYESPESGCGAAPSNQEHGLPVDAPDYDVAAQILADLGLTTIRLMANHPATPIKVNRHFLTAEPQGAPAESSSLGGQIARRRSKFRNSAQT